MQSKIKTSLMPGNTVKYLKTYLNQKKLSYKKIEDTINFCKKYKNSIFEDFSVVLLVKNSLKYEN